MGCGFQDILSWYQKKIGTYDKQEWEKTVEGRILSCITHVPKKKSVKLKTELIDVDLVRGSSFTKAKPKGGLMATTRLGLTRLIFLPAYVRWWSAQTSPRLFPLLILLYLLQVINSILYIYLPEKYTQGIPGCEILVPLVMMGLLTILHSNIVSPRSPGSKDLAPFDGDDRWRSRTKRRVRHISPEKTSDPSSEYDGLPDPGCKFSKRVRLRKSSLEDINKLTLRRRRKVAWDASPIKYNQKVIEKDDTPEPLVEEVDGCSPGDDDGFESLNSQGNNEECSGADQRDVPEAVLRNNWLEHSARRASLGRNKNASSGETDHKDSDSDNSSKRNQRLICRRRGSQQVLHVAMPPSPSTGADNSSLNSSEEEGEGGGEEASFCPAMTEGTTSAGEWIYNITTNSEDCSVSSEIDEHPFASEFHHSPSAILSPSCVASDRVSCTLWEKKEVKKADLSVLDISSAIIARVEAMPESMDYFYFGMFISMLIGFVPAICRITSSPEHSVLTDINNWTDTHVMKKNLLSYAETAFGPHKWTQCIVLIALLERTILSGMFFFLVTVAERTFKQRFLYAKFFSHLTSFRRARKSELPHFRLNKVRNIKTWLSVRSYLRKRGPQHSVDVIVSTVFFLTIFLLGFISIEYLKESDIFSSQSTTEALAWGMILGCFLLRFMTLGTKINRKYSNLSVLITEQINLYLQIEQKPNKKEELMVANSVLKLAADLLKELECPYKISGISANPYLYTITKVVILSALSGVLSEILGFKLKLHKIKIK